MAHLIVFTKPDKVNNQDFKKGDTLSVSDSWYKTLKENGSVKDFIEKQKSKGK